jgi:hypothetical protein
MPFRAERNFTGWGRGRSQEQPFRKGNGAAVGAVMDRLFHIETSRESRPTHLYRDRLMGCGGQRKALSPTRANFGSKSLLPDHFGPANSR